MQAKALQLSASEVAQCLHRCDGHMEAVDWQQKLKARTIGYDGSEVHTAELVELSRFRAALLPVGIGGSVNSATISTGFVRDALLDPSLVLRLEPPENDLPTKSFGVGSGLGLARNCCGAGESQHL